MHQSSSAYQLIKIAISSTTVGWVKINQIDLSGLISTAATPMHGNPRSLAKKCIICGIEKPLNNDCFQAVETFARGYSFYCNACDVESRRQKSSAMLAGSLDQGDGDKNLDIEADMPV